MGHTISRDVQYEKYGVKYECRMMGKIVLPIPGHLYRNGSPS